MSTNASAIFGAELRGYSSTLGFCIGRSPKRFLHINRCLENLSSGEKRAASGTERVGETEERAHGHTEQGASHCLLCALSAVVLPERVGLFGGGETGVPHPARRARGAKGDRAHLGARTQLASPLVSPSAQRRQQRRQCWALRKRVTQLPCGGLRAPIRTLSV